MASGELSTHSPVWLAKQLSWPEKSYSRSQHMPLALPPSPRKILFCGKGKLERIALTSASFTPQIQPLINCVWPRRNAKMAIQAQDASLLLDGLGQPLNLFIWRNVKIAIHQNVKAAEQDKLLKFREINKLSYVVGNQSGWVGRLTQNFLNPFDIPSRP